MNSQSKNKPMRRSVIVILAGMLVFSACTTSKKEDTESLKNKARMEGEKIAMETQKVLGSTLKSVIQSQGIPPALKYCNVHAYPLVDSLENKYQVSIKRASTATRNPADEADEEERRIILDYMETLEAGKTPEVYVNVGSDEVHFAKPIILNDQVCLNCHGDVGKEIKPEHYDIIKALYPGDDAAGHKIGDLRGIWSIRFDRSVLAGMENQ